MYAFYIMCLNSVNFHLIFHWRLLCELKELVSNCKNMNIILRTLWNRYIAVKMSRNVVSNTFSKTFLILIKVTWLLKYNDMLLKPSIMIGCRSKFFK